MNARDAIKELERVGRGSLSIPALEAALSGLRLLAAAEANDGKTPETDAAEICVQSGFEKVGTGQVPIATSRRLELRCTGLAAEVVGLREDAERYRSRQVVGWIDGYMIGLPEDAKKHPNARPVYTFDAARAGK